MENYKICGCFTRRFEKVELQPPEDVREAFNKYAEGGAYMSAEQLQRFLVEMQGEPEATSDAEKIVEEMMRLRPKRPNFAKFTTVARKPITVDDFFSFLFSVDLNPPIKSQVHQDMTAPLSHYFIYTGHNSYLTGNQLSSECSDIPIIKALKRGVRVIELDLWPNQNKEDVHVLHGKTLTNPVELTKCLNSIKEYAFCASPYPVILTLEDHLNPPLQAKVAQNLIKTFGDMLFYPKSEGSKGFLNPEELKYKVLVSTKPPKEYLTVKHFADEGKPAHEDQELKENKMTSDKNELKHEHVHGDEHEYDDSYLQEKQPEYKNLITIPGVPRGEFKDSLKVDGNKMSRLSWSEQTLAKAATSYGTDIVRFTQKNILRIFPKVTRFDSSNYEPFIGWVHGAQMVAFNMQGYGKPLWLMHGMFKANGGCGYVKKPDFLINLGPENQDFDPKADLPIKISLKVKIYMGDGWQVDFKPTHFDYYSPPDFYAKVGIAGAPSDVMMKKTKVIEDRWIPVWDEEFCFPLTVPELALLRIEVHEYDKSEKDDFAGQTCLPVSELKPGIHAVPLHDHKGEKYDSVKLLMQFEFV